MELQHNNIYQSIKDIIILARQRIYRMANSALLETYWQIGKIIVEDDIEEIDEKEDELSDDTLADLLADGDLLDEEVIDEEIAE